jgi:hypothetical protein
LALSALEAVAFLAFRVLFNCHAVTIPSNINTINKIYRLAGFFIATPIVKYHV